MAVLNVMKKIEKARMTLGLGSTERILAACTTNPKGTMKRRMAVSVGGVVGGALVAREFETSTVDPDGLAGRCVGGQNALVLTDQRLFLASLGLLSGKPKHIVAQWRRVDVVRISVEETRLSFPMTIDFADGSVVEIEGARGTDPRSLAL